MRPAAIINVTLCLVMGALVAGAQTQSAPAGAAPLERAAANTSSPAAARLPAALWPRYTPGETMRYQLSFRSQSKSLVGGAVENPQGAKELGIAVGITLQLEVLTPIPAAPASPAPPAGAKAAPGERPPLRLRAHYELVSATLSGDSYDPAAAKLLAQYQSLEGRTIEFQLGQRGELEYIEGLDEVLQDPRALEAARAWLEQLGAGFGASSSGAVPGQTWERTQVVADAPLAGTSIQTTNSYLRDQACNAENPTGEQCAVMLMRFTLGQKPGVKNTTPESYRRSGLRTSGQWTSQGESLVYVSLVTGRTVSVSQSSEELMDINIRHEDGGMPFRYAGRTKTETHLLLLNASPGAP